MAQKLNKVKLYIKKYWFYILLAFAFAVSIFAAFAGADKQNFWFKTVKKLMGLVNEVEDSLEKTYKEGQIKEDNLRHKKAEVDETINNAAATKQNENETKRNIEANEIAESTQGDPEKMVEALQNSFGIPKG